MIAGHVGVARDHRRRHQQTPRRRQYSARSRKVSRISLVISSRNSSAVGRVGEDRDREVEAREGGQPARHAQQLRRQLELLAEELELDQHVAGVAEPVRPHRVVDGEQAERRRRSAPSAALTISTWTAWLTNITRPTFSRWRRSSGGVASSDASRSSWRASAGIRTPRKSEPRTTKSPMITKKIGSRDAREDLPRLLCGEGEQGEDQEQRQRLGDQPQRRAELARQAAEDPAQDPQQPVADDRVDQAEQDEVADRGDDRALPLAAEDQRQEGRDQDEACELGLADPLGHRERGDCRFGG